MLIVKGIATLFRRWEVSVRLKAHVCICNVPLCLHAHMIRHVSVASTVKEGHLTTAESMFHVVCVSVYVCVFGYGVLK